MENQKLKKLYEGDFDGWWSHPDGVLIYKGTPMTREEWMNSTKRFIFSTVKRYGMPPTYFKDGELFLNGTEKLCDDSDWEGWYHHPKGIAIVKNNQSEIWLNGIEKIYEGPVDDWDVPKYEQAITQTPEKTLVKDGKVIYDGEFDYFAQHPKGALLNKGNAFYLLEL